MTTKTRFGTTATRSGDDLGIQNDIGTTDAHVLAVRVHETGAVVTCIDIHPRRARRVLAGRLAVERERPLEALERVARWRAVSALAWESFTGSEPGAGRPRAPRDRPALRFAPRILYPAAASPPSPLPGVSRDPPALARNMLPHENPEP